MMPRIPCKDCERRHEGCHGSCCAYAEYRKQVEEEKEFTEKQKDRFWEGVKWRKEPPRTVEARFRKMNGEKGKR